MLKPIRSTIQVWVVTRNLTVWISALVPQTSFRWETTECWRREMAAVSLGYWNGPKGYFKLKLYSSDSWMSNQKAALLLSSTNDQLAHSKVNDHKRLPICLRTGYPNCTELSIQHERAASSVTLTWVQGRRYTGFYAAVKTAHFRAVTGLVRGAFILSCSRAW